MIAKLWQSEERRVDDMKRRYGREILIGLLMIALMVPVAARADNLVKEYDTDKVSQGGLAVEVWVDNDDGIYYEDEEITLYFRANRDCYVAIYSVDTRGDVAMLFPSNRWEDGRVNGGEVYSIPGEYADFNLVVSGPEGIEHVQAVASTSRMDIPNWYDGAPIGCDADDDRDDFIDYINDEYFSCRWGNCEQAFDRTLIYIKVPSYYYKPVYTYQPWYDYPDYSVVYIDYPYGGEVYINGIYFGIAPLWIPRVAWGWQWITIYDRYGYCWEEHYHFHDQRTVYLDRTRIKTSRTMVSRYADKDIRSQAKKYDRTSYVKSDVRVKTTRDAYKKTTPRNGTTSGTSRDTWRGSTTKRSSGSSAKTGRYDKKYDGVTKRPTGYRSGSKKTDRSSDSYRKSSGSSSKKSAGYKSKTGTTRKSTGNYKGSGASKKSTSGSRSSGSSKKSSGSIKSSGASKQSSGGSKSSGSSVKSGGGSKSSGSSVKSGSSSKSSGSVKKSGGSKSSR